MGRRKLTIEETRVKNLPFSETGGFLYAFPDAGFITIDKVSVPTGKRGRKPVAFQAECKGGVLTLDPELQLSAAIEAINAFNAGAV
jgi:hypothetical protein